MSLALGAFAVLDNQLTDEIFKQFAEIVTIQKPNALPLVVTAVIDRNAESYSPYENEVVEPIIKFTFRQSKSGKLPRQTLIGLGDIAKFNGNPAEFWQYSIDRLEPTSSIVRGHSEDDGTTITYIARPL